MAVSIFDASATLVATTWKVPALAGAMYWPAESNDPPPASSTDQVTPVDCPTAVPLTAAVKLTTPFGTVDAALGEMMTEITGVATVTVAVAVFEGSATLVATTWYVPSMAGAV